MNPREIPELNRWLVENGVAVIGINSRHSFEEYFLTITNESAA
jgi:hypothetical protein